MTLPRELSTTLAKAYHALDVAGESPLVRRTPLPRSSSTSMSPDEITGWLSEARSLGGHRPRTEESPQQVDSPAHPQKRLAKKSEQPGVERPNRPRGLAE